MFLRNDFLSELMHCDAMRSFEKAGEEVFGSVAGARGDGSNFHRWIGKKTFDLRHPHSLNLFKDRMAGRLAESADRKSVV